MADDNGQRTEAATPRRREEASRKGQFPISADLATGVLLLTAVLVFWLGGAQFGSALTDIVRTGMMSVERRELNEFDTVRMLSMWVSQFVGATATIVLAAMAVSFGVSVLQVGGIRFSSEPIQLKWSKISLTGGWSKIFSWKAVVRGIGAIFKVAACSGVAFWVLRYQLIGTLNKMELTLASVINSGVQLSLLIAFGIALSILLIGLADYLFQRWNHDQDLRMSIREIQDEQRDEQGDPHMRARLRKLQREMGQRRMISDVATADVVVRNPTHYAVALRYDRGTMAAPEVVAKGKDSIALRILKAAEDNNVPVVERKPLARALYAAVDVGDVIPMELYHAVAELLSYVLKLKRAA